MNLNREEKIFKTMLKKRRDYYKKIIDAINLLLDDVKDFAEYNSLDKQSVEMNTKAVANNSNINELTLTMAVIQTLENADRKKLKPSEIADTLEKLGYTRSKSLRKSVRSTLVFLKKANKIRYERNEDPKKRGYVYWIE